MKTDVKRHLLFDRKCTIFATAKQNNPKKPPFGRLFSALNGKKHTIFFKKGPILFKKHTIL